jgi:hypothetical protein
LHFIEVDLHGNLLFPSVRFQRSVSIHPGVSRVATETKIPLLRGSRQRAWISDQCCSFLIRSPPPTRSSHRDDDGEDGCRKS